MEALEAAQKPEDDAGGQEVGGCARRRGAGLASVRLEAEAAEELEISLSTLDRKIRKGEVEVVREGRRVYVRMHGPEYMSDEELLRRSLVREDKLQRTVWELDRTVTELERERDVAREAALASRQVHKELEEAYRKETAAHKETKNLLNMVRVIAIVLFVLLVGSVLVWWFMLR